MTFFNKKEEVIEIQMTQYGKLLFSNGKFKPVYYSFSDEDIIYDIEYASLSEGQNQSEDRIKDSIRTKVQTIFNSVDKKVKEDLSDDSIQLIKGDQGILGTSSALSDFAPNWDIKYLEGHLSSLTKVTSNSYDIDFIPQLNSEINFEVTIKEIDGPGLFTEDEALNAPDISLPEVYTDGKYISVKESGFIIEVVEENTEYEKENFTIEVFLLEDNSEDNIKQLLFKNRKDDLFDDLLINEEDIKKSVKIDSATFVEYFFDIIVDDEVIIKDNSKQKNNISIYNTNTTKKDTKKDKC